MGKIWVHTSVHVGFLYHVSLSCLQAFYTDTHLSQLPSFSWPEHTTDLALAHMQKGLIPPKSWDTITHTHMQSTPEPLSQSAPSSNPFISPPHPSSKLTLKWWSSIKAAAARKNSIVISVLREELQIWGWGLFSLTLCWLAENFALRCKGMVFGRWSGFVEITSQSLYSQGSNPSF